MSMTWNYGTHADSRHSQNRCYTTYRDKYNALLRKGYPERDASRMAYNLPQVYE